VVGELFEGEDEDHPTWRSDMATHFGIAPHARIVFFGRLQSTGGSPEYWAN